jgi:hypothetical protein
MLLGQDQGLLHLLRHVVQQQLRGRLWTQAASTIPVVPHPLLTTRILPQSLRRWQLLSCRKHRQPQPLLALPAPVEALPAVLLGSGHNRPALAAAVWWQLMQQAAAVAQQQQQCS